jgi:hypothetical protein
MKADNSKTRCQGQTKSGKPCRAAATSGGLCFFHANPNKASELGRIGGRSNRQVAGESTDPPPSLDNVTALQATVARLISDVYSGKLPPRTAAGLAPLLNLQLRTIETADLERRLANIEEQLSEVKPKTEAQRKKYQRNQSIARFRQSLIQSQKPQADSDEDSDADESPADFYG